MFTRTLSRHQVSAASFPGLARRLARGLVAVEDREAGRCVAPFSDACFKLRDNKNHAVFSGIAKFDKDQRLVFDITVREGRDVAVNLAIA